MQNPGQPTAVSGLNKFGDFRGSRAIARVSYRARGNASNGMFRNLVAEYQFRVKVRIHPLHALRNTPDVWRWERTTTSRLVRCSDNTQADPCNSAKMRPGPDVTERSEAERRESRLGFEIGEVDWTLGQRSTTSE